MAITRPFAYNSGSILSGTTQVGDLAIGTNNLPVSDDYGGLSWKNGPDEDLGYVIGYPQSGGTQPLPVSGTGFVQFWRSKIPGDDTSFINLAEYISRKYYTPQTFATANDAKIWLNDNGFWTSYEQPVTPTPTETSIIPTPTPTETSIIPTPTPTAQAVTGYSFNLVALPYNFPSSGNTIMNGPGGATSGATDSNVLATGGRGLYWNSIDSNGIDRTDYFSGFTGQSITITMSQTGSTSIYSGDTSSLKTWTAATGNGFVFGAGIGVPPPPSTPSGTAVLIQSASTQWTIGLPVYISVVLNGSVTPTPTSTDVPIPTPTPTETSIIPTPTPTTPFTLKVESANSGVTITDLISGGTFTYNLTSGSFPITNSAVYGTHSATGTLNPTDVLLNFNATNSSTFTITKNGVELVNFPASAGSGQQYVLGSQFSNILSTDVMILKFQ